MANVNANVNIIINTQQAQAQLRLLTAEINNFNKQSFATNSAAARQQKALNQALIDGVKTSGQFSTSIVPITGAVDRFSDSLERGKLSLGQYTRYAASQLPGMRRILTKEFDMINSVAEDRVKRLNTQFVRIGQSANGMQQALAMTPNSLDQFSSRSAIAIQRQQIFNRMLRDGSTQLLNWGKNTQWAGRQLMVGFTIPLGILGAQAAKVFKELEAEAISFRKVYGDMFTTGAEVEENLSAIKELSVEMTKYGQSVQQTMQLANTAAQSGARGAELLAATTQATRLAVLGQMEQAQAIETTISLQTSFALSNEELAESINFLNSVENQTILSLQDVSEAIPRVASVIKGFGGDIEDLSVLLVAMKEGGVSAAEGANALKNSMARIISPTKNALEVSAKYGIALQDIVNRNDGKVVPLFQELAKALEAVGGQPRQEILSAVFGKFQYARIGTLLSNIAKDGSQAAKAIELTGLEARDLAATAEKELSTVENAVSTKFTASLEKAKLALAPVGEEFLKALTPVLDVVGKILGKFDELPGGLKTVIVAATAVIGGIAPIVLMVTGLVANGIANIAKFIMFLRKQIGTLRGNGEQFKMYSKAELDAAAASSSLEGRTTSLTRSLLLQRPAIESLITLYERLAASARIAAASMPATMGVSRVPATSGAAFAASMPRLPVVKRNAGGPIFSKNGTTVPGVGNTDKVPAMLTPGEFVINKKATQKNLPLIKAINDGGLRSKENSKMPKSLAEGIQYANIGLLMQGLRRVSGQIRPTSPSGKIFPKWFFDTRTGTNRARQKQALEDSYYLGTRFKKEDGSDYSLQEIMNLSDNKVKELWKGVHRGHMVPSVAIGGDKDYLPGILAPMMGGGKGGNLSMIRGGNPKEIYDMFSSMESRGIHPMSILFGASKELGYNASSSVFMKTYEDLMQSLLSKRTNFGGKESFESWAYRILKRNLGKIENKNGNFFEKMNYVGTVRGINPQRSKSADGGYSSGRGSLFTAMLPEFNKGGMIPGGQVNDQRNFYGRFNAKTIQMFTDWVSAQSSKTAAMKSGVIQDPAMAGMFRGGFRKSRSSEILRRATWMEQLPEVGETLSLGALSSFSPKGVPVRQHLANSPIQQNAEFAASRLATLEKQQKNDSWRLKKLRDPDAHPNTKMWADNYVSVLDRSKIGQEAAIDDLMWAMNNRKSEIAKYKKDLNIYKKNTPVIVEIETPRGTVRANIDDIVSLENQIYMGKNTFESERILHNPMIKVTGIFDDDKRVKLIKGKLISSEYPGFNAGGTIPGVGNTDKVPAMLTPGEFVINKQSTKRNLPLIQAINNGEEVAGFNKGGMIPGYSMGGRIAQQMMGRQSAKNVAEEQMTSLYTAGNFEKGFAPTPIKNFSNTENLHGPGVYTTRNKDMAQSYLRRGSEGAKSQERQLYEVGMKQSDTKKFLNMDKGMDEVSNFYKIESKIEDNAKKLGLNWDDIAPRLDQRSGNLGEWRSSLVENATDKLIKLRQAKTREAIMDAEYEASMLFVNAVKKSDYMGLTHMGGLRQGQGEVLHPVYIWYTQPKSMKNLETGQSVKMLKANKGAMVPGYNSGGMVAGVQHLAGGAQVAAMARVAQSQRRMARPKTLMDIDENAYNRSFSSIMRQSDIEDQASQTIFSSFNIRKNDKGYIFKGYGEEIPTAAMGKNKVLGITPQELLQEALLYRPNDKKLLSMLNNFNNKKYGKNETRLLDEIAASISIDRRGRMSQNEDTAGYAHVLSSLMGDQDATRLVSLKRKSLYSELDKIKQIKQKEARANPQDTDATWDDKVFIHSTARGVNIDKKGNALIYSAGDATRGTPDSVPRSTVHTTINAPVESHMAGQWGNENQLIVGNAKKVLSSNNSPSILNVTDTAFPLSPGQPLRIPNASVVTPVSDAEKYKKLLMEKKLISNDGNTPPFIINDDKSNDVLYFIKKEGTYTDDDRIAILRDTGYPAKPKDIVGRETDILKDEALTRAMRQQKVEGRPQKLGQWGTSNPSFDQGVYRLAAQKGLSGGIHQGSPSQLLEMSAIDNRSYYSSQKTPNRFGNADIYSIRHVVASGHSKTSQRKITKLSRIDDDYVTLNKGGFVPQTLRMNRGNIVPGMGNKDTVPALLTPGEFVINKQATQDNLKLLHAINGGEIQKFAMGGEARRRGRGANRTIPESLRSLPPREAAIMRMQIGEAEYAARAASRVGGQLQVDRAHNVMGGGTKSFARNPYTVPAGSPSAWSPQSAPENQWSKILAGTSERALKEQKALRKAMIDSGQSSKSVEKIMKKVELGTRLQYGETQRVAKGIQTLQQDQEKYTKTMTDNEKKAFTQRNKEFSAAAQARKEFRTGSTPKARSARAGAAFSAWEKRIGTPVPKPVESLGKIVPKSYTPANANATQVRAMQIKRENPRMNSRQALNMARLQERSSQTASIRQLRSMSSGGTPPGKRPPTFIGMPGMGEPGGKGIKPTQSRYSRINSGIGKVGMGAGMALSMASMMPMMGADEQGKWMGMDASTAMMGMMGGGMLLSIAPMLGAAAAPILGLAAAAAAAGLVFKGWRENLDESARKAAEFGSNIGGAANAAENMANILGMEDLQSQRNRTRMSVAPEEEEQFLQFSTYLEGEAGKALINSLKNLTSADKFKKVADYLRTAIASGMLDKQQATTFAKAVGANLNDTLLANNLVSNILREGVSVGSKSMLGLAQKREEEVLLNKRIQNVLQSKEPDSVNSADAAMTISASMQIIKSFQDALAVAEQEQRDGVITFQEYLDVVNATKFATQQWTDAMVKASTNTDDAGATAQGTELALKAAGVTQEQLDAYKQVSETVNIGGQAFENDTEDAMGITKVVPFGEEELRIRSGTLADLFLMNSVAEAGYGQDYEKFAAESDPQVFEKTFRDAISAQKSVEEITGVGTTRNPIYEAMIQAVEGGLMESGDATALVQQILSDPLGEAAKSFKEGGMSAQALADSLIAANADIDLAAAGIPESVQGMYQDISKQLPPAQAADFANYIAGIASPLKKEKAIRDFSAIGKGMGATGQQQVRTGFLNTGIIANQAGWSQQAVDKLRSSSQYQEALSATSRSTKYAGSSGMAIEFDPEKLERINDALAEAAEIGVSENVISFVLKEVDDSEGKIDLAKKTKEMTGYVKDLAALPDEIKIALNIDTTDGEDVERFGPDAEQLQKSWGLLSNLNPNINLMLAARFLLYDNEGNLRDPMDTARKINALNAAWKNLSSKDPDVVKQARFNIAISYAGNELGKNPADVANAAIEKLQNDFKNIGRWSPQAQEIALQTYVSSEVEGLDEAIQLANLEKELVTATGANRTAILMAMKKIQDRQKTARENAKAYVKSLDKNIGSGSTGGGGGQESPLKSFLRGILDQINMWVDASAKIGDLNKAKNSFVNQVLKGAGIFNKLNNINAINPVRLQEILGMGPEGANDFIKKYIKKGKITKEGRNVLDAATAGGAAQTIGENTISKKISNMQIDAANVARDFGASNEAIQSIAGDPKKAAELLRIQKDVKNGVEGAIKAKRKFIQSEEKAIKRAKELQEALKSPIEKAIDKQTKTMEVVGAYFDNEYAKIDESMQKEFEGQYGMSAAQMELEIKKREDVIDTYRDEIDVINEAIRAIETRTSTSSKYSEWGLEQLQKEIESNQTLISQYERQNELDQRRIETLQRQDELRNRESEALSYELDAMSQIEDKIRESYGKRLEALDKIAQVNDYILDQERQKLGLSKAISEGDIYAATAAAQEMRQGQAEFSQNQMRSGLEQGMENAVEGLRTSTGLTRDQAEERINQIKEQSYQTSLLIRDIEDKIYNNNLNNIIPLKDKEYNLNLGIKSVQDQIAIKQNEIKVIEETRIAPLEKINKNQAEALNDLALQTEVAQAAVEYEGLRKDQWDRLNNVIVAANNYAKEFSNDTIDARDNALSLANAWREVSKQIDNARKAKTDQIKILDVAQGKELEKKKANPKYENDSFNYKEELEKINKKYKEDINAILEKAPTTLQSANKGGVINKYSIGGNVLGSGSRDSISAMLTPGEYVIRKTMVDKYGIPMLSAINQGSFNMPKYQTGSEVQQISPINNTSISSISAPVYNTYDMKFSINGTNQSADDIANKVMFKMRQLQSQQVRGNRGY